MQRAEPLAMCPEAAADASTAEEEEEDGGFEQRKE
jgi:hypothetical protein